MHVPGGKVPRIPARFLTARSPRRKAGAADIEANSNLPCVVALDFETYYDADYTLRKLSTSEYIRDPRFEVISCAIRVDAGKTHVYFGKKDIKAALRMIDWKSCDLLAHHAQFDGLILTHHFGIIPQYWRCTMSMGRGLHPKTERNNLAALAVKYGCENKLEMPDFEGKHLKDLTPTERDAIWEYNTRDVDSMCQVYDHMIPSVPQKELDLIDCTMRMFTEPVLELDVPLAKKELKREIKEREAAIAKSGALALAAEAQVAMKLKKGEVLTNKKLLGSPKAFPALLRHLGIEPATKISKYNGKPTLALSKADEEFTDLLSHPDEKVVQLVRGRLASKSTIGETRAARLLRSGADGQRLPVYLNYCGAHTMRWSGGDKLNYQNFKKAGQLQQAVLAPAGYKVVVLDSKTIEVRVLAWLAGEEWLLQAFREGLDPYCVFGTDVYGRLITKTDKLERFISKVCVLQLGFQSGGPKLQTSLVIESIKQGLVPVRLDLSVAYGLVNKYRNKNKKIVALWDFMHNDVIRYIATPATESHNITRHYKGIEYRSEYVGLAGNLGLHYPEARAHITRKAPSQWGRNMDTVERVEDASYRSPNGRSKLYGGLMTENVVQYLARHVVAEQMLEIAKKYRIVMMKHDEIVYLAKDKEVKQAYEFGLKVMRTSPVWAPDLPVDAEGGYANNYSK